MRTLIYLTTFFSVFAFGITDQDLAKISAPKQLVQNSGFEAQKTGWEKTGSGTFSTSPTNPLFGSRSALWDPSATGEFLRMISLATPESGMKGGTCSLEFRYIWDAGVSGEIEAQVRDEGDAVLVSIPLDPTTSLTPKPFQINFSCPDPATKQFKVVLASTADAASIKVDDFFLGSGKNTIFAVPKNQIETKILSADVTANGVISDLTFTGLEVGATYELRGRMAFVVNAGAVDTTAQINVDNGAQNVELMFLRVDDGNTAQDLSYFAISNTFEATDTTLTFTGNSLSAISYIAGAGVRGETYVQLEKRNDLGGNFQEGLTIETSGQHWDVNIGGGVPSLGLIDVTAYTELIDASLDMVINSGSTSAEIPCSTTNPSTGITCAAGSESVGIVFNPTTAGRYKVCGEFTYIGQADQVEDIFATFQWVETPNNAQTILQEGNSRAMAGVGPGTTSGNATDISSSLNVCGNFTLTTGKKTLRLMYEQSSTGTPTTSQLLLDRSAITGQRDMHITVEKMDQQFPTPVFTDLQNSLNKKVESALGSPLSIYAATFSNAGTPAISEDHSGGGTSWIASLLDNGVGQTQITYQSGAFDGATVPVCTCSTVLNNRVCAVLGSTTTTVQFNTTNGVDGVLVDIPFKITCIGSKN